MVGATKAPWNSPNELLWQIRDIRKVSANPGFVFYSASSFDKIPRAVRDSLQNRYTKYPALPPTMPWLDKNPPAEPTLKAIPSSEGTLLKWEPGENEKGMRYAVYRFTNGEPVDTDRADRMISVQTGREFLDERANKYARCTYVVTALDRTWNESGPSNRATTER